MSNTRKRKTVFLKLIVFTAIVLIGCGENIPENTVQSEFASKIYRLQSEKGELEVVNFFGRESDGRLAPADIEIKTEQIKEELEGLLYRNNIDAIEWNAEIDAINRDGNDIVVNASHNSQHYRLRIYESAAKKMAEKFTPKEKIRFSGRIGPETSLTFSGALLLQEFSFEPSSISSKHGELRQSSVNIAERLARNNAEKEQAAEEEELRIQVIDFCKEELRSKLKYPESASFSWFKGEVTQTGENKLTYTDVLEAKNDFGGKLPKRFRCDVSLSGEKLKVSIKFFD